MKNYKSQRLHLVELNITRDIMVQINQREILIKLRGEFLMNSCGYWFTCLIQNNNKSDKFSPLNFKETE